MSEKKKMQPTVLLFGFQNPEERLKLEMALFPLEIQLKYIALSDYLNPLGYLAGNEEIKKSGLPYNGKELDAQMLVFAYMKDELLEQALAALRFAGLPSYPYKAILTPTNQHWSPLACFEEIKKEHEFMSQK